MFTNSVLKLGTVQAVTQLSGNKFKVLLIYLQKTFHLFLDFSGGKISVRFAWLMHNGFFETYNHIID